MPRIYNDVGVPWVFPGQGRPRAELRIRVNRGTSILLDTICQMDHADLGYRGAVAASCLERGLKERFNESYEGELTDLQRVKLLRRVVRSKTLSVYELRCILEEIDTKAGQLIGFFDGGEG